MVRVSSANSNKRVCRPFLTGKKPSKTNFSFGKPELTSAGTNAVAPGNILFDGSIWSKKLKDNSDSVQTMLDYNVALGNLGSPEDVASLVVYMASARSSFVTGSVWTIDGGQVHS